MKKVNPERPTGIQRQLTRQEFKVLPTRINGAQLALHFTDNYGVVCCDILIYREVTKEGRALDEEATYLFQSLGQLQTLLCSHAHHIDPSIQSHAISFLGKKAYLLTNNAKRLINCRLHPLLILIPSQIPPSPKDLASVYPLHVLQAAELESYLTKVLSTKGTDLASSRTKFQSLRKAYRFLGSALILLPLLLGLSGILLGSGLSLLAALFALAGALGPLFLLRGARSAFQQFQFIQSITIFPPTTLQTIHSDPKGRPRILLKSSPMSTPQATSIDLPVINKRRLVQPKPEDLVTTTNNSFSSETPSSLDEQATQPTTSQSSIQASRSKANQSEYPPNQKHISQATQPG